MYWKNPLDGREVVSTYHSVLTMTQEPEDPMQIWLESNKHKEEDRDQRMDSGQELRRKSGLVALRIEGFESLAPGDVARTPRRLAYAR